MKFDPKDIIVLLLVFILILIFFGIVFVALSNPNTPVNGNNLDLIIAFSGTIVTGILMYVTREKN